MELQHRESNTKMRVPDSPKTERDTNKRLGWITPMFLSLHLSTVNVQCSGARCHQVSQRMPQR